MRAKFIEALTYLASSNKDIVLVTGDLGFGSFEQFEKKFPGQYFNAGIAEQSMIGIASGLAKAGKIVFVYSIGNFVTMRCLEQIRNDACYHDLNVNLVSQGGGFTYGALGMSHHATEDIAIMRALPNMTICAPSCSKDTYDAVLQLIDIKGPSYLRLEKANTNEHSDNSLSYEIGIPKMLKEGKDILLIATGGVVNEVLDAAVTVGDELNVSVFDFHTIKPINHHIILQEIKKYKYVVSIEEHQVNGGLGSLIAEIIAENNVDVFFKRLGINDELITLVGDQAYLRDNIGIDKNSIVSFLRNIKL
ncbi:transketolase family protein [Marinomonas flavescens]|uniref:transketolase family protein n=1 Tax=Marinomonas flavescens TaxID=2529379 RepID=UPI00140502E7|nr:transketolase C-terminal domain-containing protein [Marinomonas flavescens]